MIDYSMSVTVLPAIAELRGRIVGIDGNGTGREGVLQRQDRKMAAMDEKLETLVVRSQSWSKKNVWEVAKWLLGGAGVLLANWISYHYWK